MSSGAVHGNNDRDVSMIAVAALATKYTAVKNNSAVNTVEVADANTDEAIGFTQEEQATAGAPVSVRTEGYSLAIAGTGGWTRGDKLTLSTAGVLIATTTAAQKVAAIAEDTIAATEIGEVRIISPAIRYDSF